MLLDRTVDHLRDCAMDCSSVDDRAEATSCSKAWTQLSHGNQCFSARSGRSNIRSYCHRQLPLVVDSADKSQLTNSEVDPRDFRLFSMKIDGNQETVAETAFGRPTTCTD